MTDYEAQQALRSAVRDLLSDRAPVSRVRELADGPAYDAGVWKSLVDVASGVEWPELGVVFEEAGRALAPVPLLATWGLALPALRAAGADGLAEQVAAGRTATVAWMDGAQWDAVGSATVTTRGITATRDYVVDGHVADLLLVLGTGGLFAVDAADATITQLPTLDQTRGLARVELADAPAQQVGLVDIEALLDVARIALAAEMLGAAQACLDMAVAYAKTRHQFGRPVGSFQAVKHTCAEILVQVESTRALVDGAARSLASDPARARVLAPVAKAYAAETFFRAAADNLQIHGGIGFTWEHDAHLYLKRAKASTLMFGDVAAERELTASRLGL